MRIAVLVLTSFIGLALLSGCALLGEPRNVPKTAFPKYPIKDVLYVCYELSIPKEITALALEKKIKEALEKEDVAEPRIIGSVIGGALSGTIQGISSIETAKTKADVQKNVVLLKIELYGSGIYSEEKMKSVIDSVNQIINKEIGL